MRYFSKVVAPLLLALVLLFTMSPMSTNAQTLYESLAAGDDATEPIYGASWAAQTFTTGTAHTVSSVSLKLNRTGSPEILTVSIRLTGANSTPIGADLTAGTYNGSTFNTTAAGEWYTINLTPEYSLEYATEYAIVARAVAGDGSNKIGWRYDNGNGYAAGNFTTSNNSGVGWTANASNDFMFKVYGNNAIALSNASVYSSMVEDGDWLTVFLYKNIYPPYYQYEDPREYFNLQFLDNNANQTILAQGKLPAWGYKPGAVYLRQGVATYLTWGSNYTIQMEGTSAKFDAPEPSVSHTLTPVEYIGSETFWLGEWIISSAGVIEAYYGINLTMSSLGNETFPYTILNEIGCEVYMAGIPGIEELCPERFYTITWQPEYSETDYTNLYQEQLNWVDQLSTIGGAGQIPTMLNATGAQINLSGQNIGMLIIFIAYIAVVGIALRIIGSVSWAVVVGIPVLMAGGWLGLIPLAVILIMAAISVMSVIWIIYLRGT